MLDETLSRKRRSFRAFFKTFLRVAFFLGVIIYGVFSTGTDWRQCKKCGVQDYERSFFGFVVEGLSERLYDEFGTYAQWKKDNKKDVCEHDFVTVDAESLATTLAELKR
jgi:hypothetical protein